MTYSKLKSLIWPLFELPEPTKSLTKHFIRISFNSGIYCSYENILQLLHDQHESPRLLIREVTKSPSLQPAPRCFPEPWQLPEHSPCPRACWHAGSLQLCCSENKEPHSIPSLTELLGHVPCSGVPSQASATSRFPASTSILFPDELETLLPLTASLHLSRETSKDQDVSSMHCTFCL